jgi:hypothetical protein
VCSLTISEFSTNSFQLMHYYCSVCCYLIILCSNIFRFLLGSSSGISLKLKLHKLNDNFAYVTTYKICIKPLVDMQFTCRSLFLLKILKTLNYLKYKCEKCSKICIKLMNVFKIFNRRAIASMLSILRTCDLGVGFNPQYCAYRPYKSILLLNHRYVTYLTLQLSLYD